MNKLQIASFFGCSLEQLNKQYADNAKVLSNMRDKAAKTNKKVNGYTLSQLTDMTEKYKKMSS